MKSLVNLTFYSLLIITSLVSCKREGCTDLDAVNYDPDARENDGSCAYTGGGVFWYNQSVAQGLLDDGAVSLTYYLDGQLIGSSAAGVYFTGAPLCDQTGLVNFTRDLGNSKSKAYQYEVIDQTGWVYWEGIVNISADECLQLELE
jgi:hypothetical protein